jgi:Holliday junction resolvasome RuvABC endonuclease subunit
VLEEAGVPIVPLTATTVKQRLTSGGHASKEQVQRMVLRLTHLQPTPGVRWDETDALALALAGLHQLTNPQLAARAARTPGRSRGLSPAVLAALEAAGYGSKP